MATPGTGPLYAYNQTTNPSGFKPGSLEEKNAKEYWSKNTGAPAASNFSYGSGAAGSAYAQAGSEVPLDGLGNPVVGTVYVYDSKTKKNVASSVAVEYGKAAKDLSYLKFIREQLIKYGQLDPAETNKDRVLKAFQTTLVGASQNQTDISTYLKQAQAFGFGVGAGTSTPTATLTNAASAEADINNQFQSMFDDPVPDDIKKQYVQELNALQLTRTSKTKNIKGVNVSTTAVTELEKTNILNKYITKYATQKIAAAASGDKVAIANLQKGNFGLTYNSLKSAYLENGIPFNPQTLAEQTLASSLSKDKLNSNLELIRVQAKTYFPALSDKIDAGYTVKQLLSPYINTRANILEEDPNSIDIKSLSGVAKDPKGLMGLYDYEISLRKDPKWATTKNAQDSLSGLARDMTKMFGLGA
jgi:hypothetical protein